MQQRIITIAKFALVLWICQFVYSFLWGTLHFTKGALWISAMISMLIAFFASVFATREYYKYNPILRNKSKLLFTIGVMIALVIYNTLISSFFSFIKLQDFYNNDSKGSIALFYPTIIGISLGSSESLTKLKIFIASFLLLLSMLWLTFVFAFFGEFNG